MSTFEEGAHRHIVAPRRAGNSWALLFCAMKDYVQYYETTKIAPAFDSEEFMQETECCGDRNILIISRAKFNCKLMLNNLFFNLQIGEVVNMDDVFLTCGFNHEISFPLGDYLYSVHFGNIHEIEIYRGTKCDAIYADSLNSYSNKHFELVNMIEEKLNQKVFSVMS